LIAEQLGLEQVSEQLAVELVEMPQPAVAQHAAALAVGGLAELDNSVAG